MDDSEPAEDGLLAGLRWNRSARDQAQLKHKIRDLPGLLKHGLHLRKKSQSPDTIPGPSTGPTVHKSCSQSFPCAGRTVRNAFLSHGPYPAKDKIHLARIIRRSYVGVELVQWLCEQCVYVRCRTTAVRVWQVLLELGVLLSVDQRVVFSDSNSYYQFSFEECDSASCEFRSNEGDWPEAVRLLLQLCVHVFLKIGKYRLIHKIHNIYFCVLSSFDIFLQQVQSELAAALARKTRKACEYTFNLSVCVLSREVLLLCFCFSNYIMRTRSDKDDENKYEERGGSSRTWCSITSEEDCCDSSSYRYVVVSGTPLKILEHLLSDLRLDDQRGAPEKMLLDDFLLTYLVFMSTSDLCQALLGQYPYYSTRCRGQEEGKDALFRKRKVLQLVSHWSRLYKDFLKEEEHVRSFMKTLYRCVLEDLYEFPTLEKDLKEFQKLLRRRHKQMYQQLSLKENCLQLRSPPSETRDVICCVYVSADSYLSVHTHPSLEAHELLRIVGLKMDRAEEDMVLAVVLHTGERRVLQSSDCVYSESLTPQGKLMACRRDLTDILPPLTDSAELSRRPVRLLGINTWDVAAALTHLDWSLFKSIHEQELVYYTLSRAPGTGQTAALSVLLQRCNEVQQWVMSEVLMCVSLNKRVQLLKKFIKIAAHCKAQRNLNSAFAIIMGLNTAAVSRLNQTWEKCPGKFKKLFSELELITDPSLNHKAYREAFKRMKPPKIPFMPLLLKDITFIHEGNKTFHDNLVNFEKLHMIADTVRMIRHCQSDQASVHYLHIIDNQQTLFELSHKLEPRA
uniref:Rap guanine nucleotide exchange factor 5 n=1 Tax=Dicentrarchus labrax TaxID=13489 RepID=A0A8C4HIT3_DICLA